MKKKSKAVRKSGKQAKHKRIGVQDGKAFSLKENKLKTLEEIAQEVFDEPFDPKHIQNTMKQFFKDNQFIDADKDPILNGTNKSENTDAEDDYPDED